MGSFFQETNGILSCYCAYPTQFSKISKLRGYMSTLKELGFTSFWINPIHIAGDIDGFIKSDKNNGVRVGNEVTRSLYAMKDHENISPYFSDAPADMGAEERKIFNKESLLALTNEARANGIVPMFDLVLGHVSADALIFQTKPEWFEGMHPDFKDARKFKYSDATIRNEIINEFWKPFIKRYMIDYGFDGVRVDAVAYLHPKIREELYKYIYQLAESCGKPQPIILDEALFAKMPLEDEVEILKLNGKGPSHITIEGYLANWHHQTEMPSWLARQESMKSSVVFEQKDGSPRINAKGGTVNFCGNHDYTSLAMTIYREMAEERLEKVEDLAEVFKKIEKNDYSLKNIFLYPYIKDIQTEILTSLETRQEVECRMRAKIAAAALTTSGGWFALAGDETGDPFAKPVFRRRNALEQDYYPQQVHHIFLSENREKAEKIIFLWAKKLCEADNNGVACLASDYIEDERLSQRLLSSYIENLMNQINAGDTKVCNEFKQLLQSEGIDFSYRTEDYQSQPRTPENGWQGKHDMRAFMKDINQIVKKLPSSKPGFWSEIVSVAENPELFIVVRKNGNNISSTDLIVVNLTPEHPVTLTKSLVQTIANKFVTNALSRPESSGLSEVQAFDAVIRCMEQGRIHTSTGVNLHPALMFTPSSISCTLFPSLREEKQRVATTEKFEVIKPHSNK